MDFLEEIGARRYLNAEDTFTKNGASRMSPAVYQAMQEASAWWVDLYEVQRETGRAIARMTRNEGAYITSGAACGLTLCAAAALCGEDWDAWHALPDASRLAKNEAVLLTPQLTPYACSVAASGARIVQAGAPGEYVSARVLEQAVTEKTAVIFYFLYHGACLSLPLEEALRVAKAKGVPLVVDAAAQLPPAENLWKYTRMGADLVVFSGGKALAGPQDSGLVFGSQKWIERFIRFGAPEAGVCRGCKATRESMAGLYAALKEFLAEDEEARQKQLMEKCLLGRRTMERCGFRNIRLDPLGPVGQTSPRVYGEPPAATAAVLRESLREAGLLVGLEGEGIWFHPQMLTLQQTQEACRILAEQAGNPAQA